MSYELNDEMDELNNKVRNNLQGFIKYIITNNINYLKNTDIIEKELNKIKEKIEKDYKSCIESTNHLDCIDCKNECENYQSKQLSLQELDVYSTDYIENNDIYFIGINSGIGKTYSLFNIFKDFSHKKISYYKKINETDKINTEKQMKFLMCTPTHSIITDSINKYDKDEKYTYYVKPKNDLCRNEFIKNKYEGVHFKNVCKKNCHMYKSDECLYKQQNKELRDDVLHDKTIHDKFIIMTHHNLLNYFDLVKYKIDYLGIDESFLDTICQVGDNGGLNIENINYIDNFLRFLGDKKNIKIFKLFVNDLKTFDLSIIKNNSFRYFKDMSYENFLDYKYQISDSFQKVYINNFFDDEEKRNDFIYRKIEDILDILFDFLEVLVFETDNNMLDLKVDNGFLKVYGYSTIRLKYLVNNTRKIILTDATGEKQFRDFSLKAGVKCYFWEDESKVDQNNFYNYKTETSYGRYSQNKINKNIKGFVDDIELCLQHSIIINNSKNIVLGIKRSNGKDNNKLLNGLLSKYSKRYNVKIDEVNYYSNTRGVNKYENYDTIILAGTPYVPPYVLELNKLVTDSNQDKTALDELFQTAMRLRLATNSNKNVYCLCEDLSNSHFKIDAKFNNIDEMRNFLKKEIKGR